MKEFMLIIKGDSRQCSPEELQIKLGNYQGWMKKWGDSGNYISGAPFFPEGKYIDAKANVKESGDFLSEKEIIGGYVHLKANDINQATEIAKECPLLNPMEIMVRPFHDMK